MREVQTSSREGQSAGTARSATLVGREAAAAEARMAGLHLGHVPPYRLDSSFEHTEHCSKLFSSSQLCGISPINLPPACSSTWFLRDCLLVHPVARLQSASGQPGTGQKSLLAVLRGKLRCPSVSALVALAGLRRLGAVSDCSVVLAGVAAAVAGVAPPVLVAWVAAAPAKAAAACAGAVGGGAGARAAGATVTVAVGRVAVFVAVAAALAVACVPAASAAVLGAPAVGARAACAPAVCAPAARLPAACAAVAAVVCSSKGAKSIATGESRAMSLSPCTISPVDPRCLISLSGGLLNDRLLLAVRGGVAVFQAVPLHPSGLLKRVGL